MSRVEASGSYLYGEEMACPIVTFDCLNQVLVLVSLPSMVFSMIFLTARRIFDQDDSFCLHGIQHNIWSLRCGKYFSGEYQFGGTDVSHHDPVPCLLEEPKRLVSSTPQYHKQN